MFILCCVCGSCSRQCVELCVVRDVVCGVVLCTVCGVLCVYVATFWAFCGGFCRAVLVRVFYGFGQCGVCHCVWIVSSVFVCAGLWVGGMWLGFAL